MKRVFTSWEECRKLREVKVCASVGACSGVASCFTATPRVARVSPPRQSLMTLNKHPNVVRLLKVTLDRDHRLYLVFEFLPSNLYAVSQQQTLSLPQVREYMYACVHARRSVCVGERRRRL